MHWEKGKRVFYDGYISCKRIQVERYKTNIRYYDEILYEFNLFKAIRNINRFRIRKIKTY